MKKTLIIIIGIIILIAVTIFVYVKYFRYQADVVVAPVCGDGICQSGESISSCPNDCFKVITSSNNVTDFQKQLLPTDFGNGCSGTPESCLNKVKTKVEAKGIDKTGEYLAISKDPALIAGYALQYSQLSVQNPWLKEISIDDFYYTYRDWKTAGVDYKTLIETVATNTKQANPNLKFGVILYEEQLESALLSDEELPASTKAKIDYVHLFIHYRENGSNYRNYVNWIKSHYPNAKVIAGVYDYDRIDYMPCAYSPNGFTRPLAADIKCTAQEELDYYKETLQIQTEMLKNAEVYALHLYTGPYDAQTPWPGFDSSINCLPERKEECIQNTTVINEATFQILNLARGLPAASTETTASEPQTATYSTGDTPAGVFEENQSRQNQTDESTVDQTYNDTTEQDSQIAANSEYSAATGADQTEETNEPEQDLTQAGPENYRNLFISLYIALILTIVVALFKGTKGKKYPF